jgi:hypothetical protein
LLRDYRKLVALFALRPPVDYDLFCLMTTENLLPCDGCGQLASPEHISKRLQRLEWTTRYRPVHIGTLLLGAVAPRSDSDFLYAEGGEFRGDAGIILAAAGFPILGKAAEAVLAEFQRGGFLLTYVLDCPFKPNVDPGELQRLLERRFPAVLARVRRSLRPKRLVPIAQALDASLGALENASLGCAVVLDGGKAFALDGASPDQAIERLRQALAVAAAASR